MKLNITKNDARFVVNPEKRKVVCIIEDTAFLFVDFMQKNFKIDVMGLWEDSTVSALCRRLEMPKRFVGIATCDPNDEWNEELGKLIAFSRAKDKLNTSFFKRADTYVNTVDTWLNDAMDLLNKYGEKITVSTELRHNRVDNLIDGGE